MTPRNLELSQIATACKDLSDTERLVFEAQYASHRCDPGVLTLLAWLLWDRFYLGQVGSGFFKFITVGGVGIWALVDLITARRRAAEHNAAAIGDIAAHLVAARS